MNEPTLPRTLRDSGRSLTFPAPFGTAPNAAVVEASPRVIAPRERKVTSRTQLIAPAERRAPSSADGAPLVLAHDVPPPPPPPAGRRRAATSPRSTSTPRTASRTASPLLRPGRGGGGAAQRGAAAARATRPTWRSPRGGADCSRRACGTSRARRRATLAAGLAPAEAHAARAPDAAGFFGERRRAALPVPAPALARPSRARRGRRQQPAAPPRARAPAPSAAAASARSPTCASWREYSGARGDYPYHAREAGERRRCGRQRCAVHVGVLCGDRRLSFDRPRHGSRPSSATMTAGAAALRRLVDLIFAKWRRLLALLACAPLRLYPRVRAKFDFKGPPADRHDYERCRPAPAALPYIAAVAARRFRRPCVATGQLGGVKILNIAHRRGMITERGEKR